MPDLSANRLKAHFGLDTSRINVSNCNRNNFELSHGDFNQKVTIIYIYLATSVM